MRRAKLMLVLALTTWLVPCLEAQATGRMSAKLTSISGDVSVRRSGGSFADANRGQELQASDDLSTGPDSSATLTFSDGSTMVVRPLSQISLASLTRQRDNVKVRVNLRIGQVAAKINKTQTETTDYSIKTPTATAAVRGTEFRLISYYPPRGTETELIGGRVLVSGRRGAVLAGPDERTIITDGDTIHSPREVRQELSRVRVEPVGVTPEERAQIAIANEPIATPVTGPGAPAAGVTGSSSGANGGASLVVRFQR